MSKLPEKIIKPIFSYGKFNIKFHVKLANDKNESFHYEYEYNQKKYLRLNHMGFLSFEISSDNVWDPSNSIMITINNICNLISGFKRMLKDIYDKKIFSLKKNGDIIIYKDLARQSIHKIPIMNSSSIIVLEPTIVTDENDIQYEGVNLFINKTENVVQIPIQYFETICYILDKIDIIEYTNSILIYYMVYYDKSETNSKDIQKRKVVDFSKPDIIINDSPKSNFSKNENIEKILFDGLI